MRELVRTQPDSVELTTASSLAASCAAAAGDGPATTNTNARKTHDRMEVTTTPLENGDPCATRHARRPLRSGQPMQIRCPNGPALLLGAFVAGRAGAAVSE